MNVSDEGSKVTKTNYRYMYISPFYNRYSYSKV